MGHIGEQIVTVLSLIVGVAVIAVIVSRNSQTAAVITAGGNAFAQALGTAVSPITGFTGGASGSLRPSIQPASYFSPYNGIGA